jgi:hypothetical protein
VSDAVAIIVSEQTGQIAVTHSGRMLHRLDVERLESILTSFLNPEKDQPEDNRLLKPRKNKILHGKDDRRVE